MKQLLVQLSKKIANVIDEREANTKKQYDEEAKIIRELTKIKTDIDKKLGKPASDLTQQDLKSLPFTDTDAYIFYGDYATAIKNKLPRLMADSWWKTEYPLKQMLTAMLSQLEVEATNLNELSKKQAEDERFKKLEEAVNQNKLEIQKANQEVENEKKLRIDANNQLMLYQQNPENLIVSLDVSKLKNSKALFQAMNQLQQRLEAAEKKSENLDPFEKKCLVQHPPLNSDEFKSWKKSNPKQNDQLKLQDCVSSVRYHATCALIFYIEENETKLTSTSTIVQLPPEILDAKKLVQQLLSKENWDKPWQNSVESILKPAIAVQQVKSFNDLLTEISSTSFSTKYGDAAPTTWKADVRAEVLTKMLGTGIFIPKANIESTPSVNQSVLNTN